MRITDVPMLCLNCGWRGPVIACESGKDGELRCPKCDTRVTMIEKQKEK